MKSSDNCWSRKSKFVLRAGFSGCLLRNWNEVDERFLTIFAIWSYSDKLFCNIVTRNWSWMQYLDPESKRQSTEHRHQISSKPSLLSYFGTLKMSRTCRILKECVLTFLKNENSRHRWTTTEVYCLSLIVWITCHTAKIWFHLTSVSFRNWRKFWEDVTSCKSKESQRCVDGSCVIGYP